MSNVFETALAAKLRQMLKDEAERRSDILVRGKVSTFEQYHYAVGTLEGIRLAFILLDAVEKELSEPQPQKGKTAA